MATTKQSTQEKTVEKKASEKKEQVLPMSKVVDALLLKGGTLESIVKKAKSEADRRKITTLSTKGQITAHLRFRILKGMKVKMVKDTVIPTK